MEQAEAVLQAQEAVAVLEVLPQLMAVLVVLGLLEQFQVDILRLAN